MCVTSIEFRLSAVATFHIRPEHLPVSATRYVIAVLQSVARSIEVNNLWLSAHNCDSFRHGVLQRLRFSLSLPSTAFVVGGAMHRARRAPKVVAAVRHGAKDRRQSNGIIALMARA